MELRVGLVVAMLAAGCHAGQDPRGENGPDSGVDSSGGLEESQPPFPDDTAPDSTVGPDTGSPDGDGDGFRVSEDCDDGDATIYPGADDELCDGVDRDCDGVVGAALFGGREYATIQDAMSAAGAGGTVSICPGTHTERLGMSVGQDLVLESFSGSHEDTVLSGEGTHRILTLAGGSVVELVGLSLMHGYDVADGGGAVHAQDAGFVLRDCYLADNETGRGGGALLFSGVLPVGFAQLELERCDFEDNLAAESGGVLYAATQTDAASLRVSDCRFEGNSSFEGGALYLSSDHADVELVVEGSTFEANSAVFAGGAASCWSDLGSSVQLIDSSFIGHSAGAAAVLWAYMRDAGSLAIVGSDFQANTSTMDPGGAIYVSQAGSALIEISVDESWFEDNVSASEAGALGLFAHADAKVAIHDTTFSGNACQHHGAAYFHADGVLNATLERVDVVDNVCTGTNASCVGGVSLGGSSAGYLDLDHGSFNGNVGTDVGGLMVTFDEVSLSSTAVDWGEGSGDNSPSDLEYGGWVFDDLGSSETFDCGAGGCL